MPPPLMRLMRAAVRARRLMRGPLRPSWSLKFETLARFLHHYSKRSTLLPLSIQRRMLGPAPSTRLTRTMQHEEVSAGGVPGEWFRSPESDDDDVFLYLHGGGYSVGSIGSHREIVSRICLASGMRALSIDYRLAPEHPFPAQLDDARAAYRWLLDRNVAPSRIVIAGDSAGGGLTLSTLLSLRDARWPLPAAAVLISPWVDLEATGETMRTNDRYDYVSRRTLLVFARRFVRDDQLRDPLASPLHADLRGLPPLLVQAGGAETLLDDARRIAAKARKAGVDVTLEVEEDMIHVWHSFAPMEPRGQQAIERIGAFMRARVGSRDEASAARAN
jgi:acetyl esterase/lipase